MTTPDRVLPATLPTRSAADFSAPQTWIKRLLPRTLFGRSLMIIITPVLLMQVAAAFYFYDRHWDIMTQRLSDGVAGEIALIIEELQRSDEPEVRSTLFTRAARTLALIITLEEGLTLTPQEEGSRYDLLRSRLSDALRDKVNRPFRIDPIVANDWSIIEVEIDEGVLQILVPRRRLYSATSLIFIFWMVGSAVVLFAVALIFMRNQIRPIRRLATAADRFGKGRDVPGFKVEGASEVRQVARAFLVMRERIRRQISQRTDMLAGVSHDLRTPLTRMKLQLALAGDGPEVDELRADVAEMEMMIEGYLAFARGEGTETPQPTDLEVLLAEVVNAAQREGANVELTIDDGVMLPLRPQAIRRCLANLLSNARRHARRVWVRVGRRGLRAEITVDDDGPGIPEALRETVFKPFYRIDPSRNPDTGGTGLGLTIARDVVRSHGGDLTLHQSPRGGLRCRIRLPL